MESACHIGVIMFPPRARDHCQSQGRAAHRTSSGHQGLRVGLRQIYSPGPKRSSGIWGGFYAPDRRAQKTSVAAWNFPSGKCGQGLIRGVMTHCFVPFMSA